MAIPEEPKTSAKSAGLRYVTDESPGITRKRVGSWFRFYNIEDKPIKSPAELNRIRSLAIPPTWRDVWICPKENGHLQATGIDARGRKQYLYHPDWRTVRDEVKYGSLIPFARVLPKIRARVDEAMKLPSLTREKVLATIVKLSEISLIRIGNEEYARTNNSFGLTTMHNRHAEVSGLTARFQFLGKSGKRHTVQVSHRRIAAIVRKCQDLPGQHLFEYLDEDGKPVQVGSEDVNDYLKTITGEPFTAKDFRTWAGTVLMAMALTKMEEASSKAMAKRHVTTAIKAVAQILGNTPAVCRKCYVHPVITARYMVVPLHTVFALGPIRKARSLYTTLNPRSQQFLPCFARG
jgi:DNA topoisomerase-1